MMLFSFLSRRPFPEFSDRRLINAQSITAFIASVEGGWVIRGGPPGVRLPLRLCFPAASFVLLRFCLCAPVSAHLGTGAAPAECCSALHCAPFSFSFLCCCASLAFAWSNLPVFERLSGACSAPVCLVFVPLLSRLPRFRLEQPTNFWTFEWSVLRSRALPWVCQALKQ